MDEDVRIGRLRWRVTLALRTQDPTPGTGAADEFSLIQTLQADVQPTGAVTFYGSIATDTPVTHRIFLRWVDGIDMRHVVLRDTKRPDGSVRREVFRVRRVMELAGRKRFALLECELETQA